MYDSAEGTFQFLRPPTTLETKKKLCALFFTDSMIYNSGIFGLGRRGEEEQTLLSLSFSSSGVSVSFF